MASDASSFGPPPTIITVPGLGGSGEDHWQTRWEGLRPDTIRAELGDWDSPGREGWVARLDDAVRGARAPVLLAAHSLGCIAVAWLAQLSLRQRDWPVVGALLVAPADVDRDDAPGELRSFAPVPTAALPFRSVVVASANDPWITIGRAHAFAAGWGSRLVEVGALGHLNAASGLGDWPEGQALLDELLPAYSRDASCGARAGA